MNIIIAIILILVVIGADYVLYKKLSNLLPKEKPAQAVSVRAESVPDDRASNSEQRYMEGIENVLNYDIETMKKYLRGEDEA